MPRTLPTPSPETRHFWEGCKVGELRLQRCRRCSEPYFPPRPFCPHCASREVDVFTASGKATLYSYIINHRPRADIGTEPHSIALVELAEGPRMMTNVINCPQTPEALQLDMPLQVVFGNESAEISLPYFEPAGETARMKGVAVVGAAETTRLGVIPELSVIGLHADAALNAMADAGLQPFEIDGLATAGEYPPALAAYLGLAPKWIDGTSVGGCSFMLHVRHAAAAIEAGYCTTVLITHGESGRSGVGRVPHSTSTSSLAAEFEYPYGVAGAPSNLTIPALRYMKDRNTSEEDLARVVVIQREWAAMNPRATLKTSITVEEVLNSEIIAWPFRKPMCCLRTDGGGALILTGAARAKDFAGKPVYVMGTGEGVESPMVSMMKDCTTFRGFRSAGADAFVQAGITHADVDHLMIYDAFAHLPLYGLEDLGFCEPGEAKDFIRGRHTAPGGKLPMNTNGGGLCYMHSGMYGMYALQESVRQLRGIAPAQVPDAKISVCVGVGGMFAAAGVIIFTSEAPTVPRRA